MGGYTANMLSTFTGGEHPRQSCVMKPCLVFPLECAGKFPRGVLRRL